MTRNATQKTYLLLELELGAVVVAVGGMLDRLAALLDLLFGANVAKVARHLHATNEQQSEPCLETTANVRDLHLILKVSVVGAMVEEVEHDQIDDRRRELQQRQR
jgi:hypothetical protein